MRRPGDAKKINKIDFVAPWRRGVHIFAKGNERLGATTPREKSLFCSVSLWLCG
jgi:hypothetical protein